MCFLVSLPSAGYKATKESCGEFTQSVDDSGSDGWRPQTEVRWNFECMKTFSLPPARARAFSSKTRQRAQQKLAGSTRWLVVAEQEQSIAARMSVCFSLSRYSTYVRVCMCARARQCDVLCCIQRLAIFPPPIIKYEIIWEMRMRRWQQRGARIRKQIQTLNAP